MGFISQHKILSLLLILILIGGAWYALSGSSPAPELATTPTTSAADGDLITTLLALRAVKLDGNIFSDPSYMSLRDFSTEIVPEAVGRPNPFAPLQSSVQPSSTTTRSAQIFTPKR